MSGMVKIIDMMGKCLEDNKKLTAENKGLKEKNEDMLSKMDDIWNSLPSVFIAEQEETTSRGIIAEIEKLKEELKEAVKENEANDKTITRLQKERNYLGDYEGGATSESEEEEDDDDESDEETVKSCDYCDNDRDPLLSSWGNGSRQRSCATCHKKSNDDHWVQKS